MSVKSLWTFYRIIICRSGRYSLDIGNRAMGGCPNQTRRLAMDIQRNGSQPSGKGPAEYFTGTVRIDPLFQARSPARTLGASVTSEPGARTVWHTDPFGQTLIVTSGAGWGHHDCGPKYEMRPGDWGLCTAG